jgi:CheY-like chemotaxis protein
MSCLVLVVEDDPDVRESLTEVLSDSAYTTVAVANGQEALDHLRAGGETPCVILLDIMMPVMDGREFRIIQRADPELGQIPVVILTAHADIAEAATSLQAAAYLRKPVQLRALLDVVHKFCRAA